jgi:nitrogen fixation protein FixH
MPERRRVAETFGAQMMGSRTMAKRRSPWQWFPVAIIAALVTVFLVNAVMVKLALDTFPGATKGEVFDVSNRYDRILDRARQEAALGWTVDIGVMEGRPVVTLNAPPQATIEATAERPVGPPERTTLVFTSTGARRVADTVLAPGQWDVMVTIADGEHTLHTEKRVIVR